MITIIHDLRSHRKQKMAIDREMRSLNRNDLVIAHNAAMSAWLTEHGLTIGTVNLNILITCVTFLQQNRWRWTQGPSLTGLCRGSGEAQERLPVSIG